MRLNNIRFAVLVLIVILFTGQTLFTQTRPRRVQDQADHPQTTTQTTETVSRDRKLNHPLPTVDTERIDRVLNQYLKNCAETDRSCQTRRVRIRTAAITLVDLLADEDRAATIPSRRNFQVRKYATYHVANFSNPIRRAPLRRKGRTQH